MLVLFTELTEYGLRLLKNFPKHFVVTGAVECSVFLITLKQFIMSRFFFHVKAFLFKNLRHNLQTTKL